MIIIAYPQTPLVCTSEPKGCMPRLTVNSALEFEADAGIVVSINGTRYYLGDARTCPNPQIHPITLPQSTKINELGVVPTMISTDLEVNLSKNGTDVICLKAGTVITKVSDHIRFVLADDTNASIEWSSGPSRSREPVSDFHELCSPSEQTSDYRQTRDYYRSGWIFYGSVALGVGIASVVCMEAMGSDPASE